MVDYQNGVAHALGMDERELVDAIVNRYLAEFPSSQAVSLDRAALVSWTREYLGELDGALRGEELEPHGGLWFTGDMVSGLSGPFLPLANLIEGRVFVARSVAECARLRLAGNPRREQELVMRVEGATLRIISQEMHHFADSELVAGCLMRHWQSGQHASNDSGGGKPAASLIDLSRRELEVLEKAALGKTNGEIAASLGIAQNTVKNHLARVYDKLNVNNRAELVRKALAMGLISS